MCNGKGRGHGHYTSFGKRRRRNINGEEKSSYTERGESSAREIGEGQDDETATGDGYYDSPQPLYQERKNATENNDGEEVHELFRVYLSRADVPDNLDSSLPGSTSNHHLDPESALLLPDEKVCLTSSGYYTLVTCITVLVTLLLSLAFAGVLAVRNGKKQPGVLHHRS